MKRFTSIILAIMLIVGTCAFAITANAAEKDLNFVIIPKCVHEWFDAVNQGAQKQAEVLSEQLGVKVTVDYRAPSAADVTEQNTILEQAAATQPDGIAIFR